jgi:hypothetical protein
MRQLIKIEKYYFIPQIDKYYFKYTFTVVRASEPTH